MLTNQKDISTWTTSDISSWLKSINMSQYISKFELNKINGYDLIYLTKEDLKYLGIVNIHDKNIILNSMKKYLLQQLKLNINYKNKFATIQLDFDPNYTVEQLIKNIKLIFNPEKEIFLVVNNVEILMSNLKIIDLILFDPQIYKNFKIISDEINLFNYSNNIYPNVDSDKKILTKTPNKNLYKSYKNSSNCDNLENIYNSNNNINNRNKLNNNINEEYYGNYKTYDDYTKLKEKKIDNNLYDYNNSNNINLKQKKNSTLSAYRKNYSIKNGELNLDIGNINLNKIKHEEEDGQKYSSEKRNYRLKELNYENNDILGKNNFNYNVNNLNNLNDLNANDNLRMNYTSATSGFNENIQFNNNINLKYKK